MPNPGVAIPAMTKANLKIMIYYIRNFKKIGRTCTHAHVDLYKVHAIFHQWDMEETHKGPEVVPTIDPK